MVKEKKKKANMVLLHKMCRTTEVCYKGLLKPSQFIVWKWHISITGYGDLNTGKRKKIQSCHIIGRNVKWGL